ncbi:MAG TPA: hypothetical protein VHI13_21795 [Candidatus Kapabacteria bacterium]|nr:hypothetical protein [Candidatus Kapabacteria bacterium]
MPRITMVFLCTIAFAFLTARAFAGNQLVFIHRIDCPNGCTNAFEVNVIDGSTGCVLEVWGVDCNDQYYRYLPLGRIVGSPPAPYDLIDHGVSVDGNDWWLKVELLNGRPVLIWGRSATGDPYIAPIGI